VGGAAGFRAQMNFARYFERERGREIYVTLVMLMFAFGSFAFLRLALILCENLLRGDHHV
jgi:hypothetical protein